MIMVVENRTYLGNKDGGIWTFLWEGFENETTTDEHETGYMYTVAQSATASEELTLDMAGTLEVHALNVHFADITIAPGSVSVTNAEGEPLSEQEIQAIKEIIEVIEGAQDIFEDLLEPAEFLFNN